MLGNVPDEIVMLVFNLSQGEDNSDDERPSQVTRW
jgi:hypothetical protein